MATSMPGDPMVLQRRVYVTLLATGAVSVLAPGVGALMGVPPRIGLLWMVVPALMVGGVNALVWWRRSRTASRQLSADLFEGSPPMPPEASELTDEIEEIRGLVADPGFWAGSMKGVRWGTGARCRELAADARRFELDMLADRLMVLADALDPGRVDPAAAELVER